MTNIKLKTLEANRLMMSFIVQYLTFFYKTKVSKCFKCIFQKVNTMQIVINEWEKAAKTTQLSLIQGHTTLGELRFLIGRLRHLSTCVPAARVFVQEIQHMVNIANDRPSDAALNVSKEASTDLHF